MMNDECRKWVMARFIIHRFAFIIPEI